jgi:hypothetical protein
MVLGKIKATIVEKSYEIMILSSISLTATVIYLTMNLALSLKKLDLTNLKEYDNGDSD